MIMETPSAKFELIHQTVSQPYNQMTVKELCAIAGVSKSGYYHWVGAEPVRNAREQADRADFEQVLEAYNRRGYTKGAKGIHMCLLHNTPPVIMNVKKIRRLMDKYRLICPNNVILSFMSINHGYIFSVHGCKKMSLTWGTY